MTIFEETTLTVSSEPEVCNHDLLARIPLDAAAILDVGCGTGALGAAYRKLNPRARLFGIERDAKAAIVARTRMDEVAIADVELEPWPFSPGCDLDCIVYGDVLQHLQNPIATLRAHRKLLRPGGVVLICVPNIEHWSIIARLFRGAWGYETSGLLDVGHLRWFNLTSVMRAVREVGLSVREAYGRAFQSDATNAFLKVVTPALKALSIDHTEYGRRAGSFQYVLHCYLGAPNRSDIPEIDRLATGEEVPAAIASTDVLDQTNRIASSAAHTTDVASGRSLQPLLPEAEDGAAERGMLKVSFRGDWSHSPSQACLAALSSAICMSDDTQAPFLLMPGLSGRSFRVFMNLLFQHFEDPHYLELGVGAGSVMASALHANRITALGVDNYSDQRYTRTGFERNIAAIDSSRASVTLAERQFNEVDTTWPAPFDVVFYDGPTKPSVVLEALSVALPAMRNIAIYILDDWNSLEVQEGYRLFMAAGLAREVGSTEIRTTLDGSHPAIYGEKSLWHNGCLIAVLERLEPREVSVGSNSPVAISECATAITAVQESAPWDSPCTVDLGPHFPNSAFFQKRSHAARLNTYVLHEVTCNFATMLVYSEGRPIKETGYLVSDNELLASAPPADRVEICESTDLVVQPLSRAWRNYYHWTVQTLPAILIGTESDDPRILALPTLTPAQEEAILLLGLREYPRFPVMLEKAYHFHRLQVSDFIAGRSSFEISITTKRVFQKMKSRVVHEKIGGPRLYLTRRGWGHRVVHNEEELSALLERRGLQIVDPGSYSISEQINLFRNADVIVAPHGAALTNIGFCQERTLVYELMPRDYANACFNRLAQLMGLRYHADAFTNDDSGMLHMRSFAVDLKTVNNSLDALGV